MALALLLYFFVVVIVSPIPAQPLLAAAAADGGCAPKQCGKLNISAPFGLVLEGSEENKCGLQMGFQVHCTDDVPYLGYYLLKFRIRILHIFYGNFSLLVSDVHKLGDFDRSSEEGCHVPTADTASKIAHPFSISDHNQNLIFYNCTKAPPTPDTVRRDGLVDTVCLNNTFVRAGALYKDGTDGGYHDLEGCSSTAVPVVGKYGKLNASDYMELIRGGFLLTWQPPRDPQQPQAAGTGGKELTRQIS